MEAVFPAPRPARRAVSRVRLTNLDSEPELLDLVDQVAGVGGQVAGSMRLRATRWTQVPGTRRARSAPSIARSAASSAGSGGQARARACSAPGGARDPGGRDRRHRPGPTVPRRGGVSARPQQPVVGPGRDQVHVRLVLAGVEPVEAPGSSAPRGRAAPPAAGRRARRRRRRSARPPRRGPRARPRLRSGSSRDRLGPRGAAGSAGWAPRTRPRSCGADRAAAGRPEA